MLRSEIDLTMLESPAKRISIAECVRRVELINLLIIMPLEIKLVVNRSLKFNILIKTKAESSACDTLFIDDCSKYFTL